MSCEHVQERISMVLDGRLPAGEQESVLTHVDMCRDCGMHLAELQTQRAELRKLAQAPIPDLLVARLNVIASHECQRNAARASVRERMRRLAQTARLIFDNLMRPVALPVTGGLLSAVLLFGLMIPTFSFARPTTGHQLMAMPPLEPLYIRPSGRVVTNPYDEVADADEDFPRIEPITTTPSDFLNVVDLTIDETGKVVDWTIVQGQLTQDMKSVILFSSFVPASYFGIVTTGKIRLVQSAPSATVRG